MQTFFAEWYSEFEINPPTEKVEKRIRGALAYCETLTPTKTIQLARFFFHGQMADDPLRALKAPFLEIDSTFGSGGNSRELRFLAGAILTGVQKTTRSLADVAALSVVTLSLQGQRATMFPRVVAEAEAFLD